jgi:type IV secretion system protein VirD4
VGDLLTHTLPRFVYRLIVLSHRIRTFFEHSPHLHTARFAHPHELETLHSRTWDAEPGLLLGVSSFNHVLTVRPTKKRRELGNLLVSAPSRGGKGLLAVSQLLTWPHSVIVNDIKGDLYVQTAEYRRRAGNRILVFDPEGYGHEHDPLASKYTEDGLLSSATHLLFKPDEGDGAIFTQRATMMLTQLFLAAKQEGYAPLPYVRQLIHDGLLATAAKLDTISPRLATKFLDSEFKDANFSDRFLQSAWSTLSARLYPLLTETVVRSLAGADFAVKDIMTADKPITLYLRWNERDLLALAPLVRLMWGSLIDELITTYDKAQGKNCHPVLLLIDEAGRTAIPSLADHATTVNGRGISLWIAIQSLSQLDAVYGHARARTLRDNMDSQIYYRPADLTTASYLEERLGRHSEYARSKTSREGGGDSEGLSEQAISLLTAWEVQRMRDDQIIGFHQLLPPFKARRMDWRAHPILKSRHGLTPPPLPVLPPLGKKAPTTIWQSLKHSSLFVDPDERYTKN